MLIAFCGEPSWTEQIRMIQAMVAEDIILKATYFFSILRGIDASKDFFSFSFRKIRKFKMLWLIIKLSPTCIYSISFSKEFSKWDAEIQHESQSALVFIRNY